jgi:hypothetical protein
MRFTLTATGFQESMPDLVPNFVKDALQSAAEATTITIIDKVMMWAVHIGLPILTEALLVWALFCFLMAITGKGPWMERGVKTLIGFALLGVASHAV